MVRHPSHDHEERETASEHPGANEGFESSGFGQGDGQLRWRAHDSHAETGPASTLFGEIQDEIERAIG